MKLIGILGGMSAASTQLYYREFTRLAHMRLGGLHGANLLIRAIDFAQVERLQAAGDWDSCGALLNAEALALQAGGAEALVLATNTMHKVASKMMQGLSIPLLHIAEATALALQTAGHQRPALMATRFTMEQAFYLDVLRQAGLHPMVPEAPDRDATHRIIYQELCQGIIRKESRSAFEAIAGRLQAAGADSLILGCTEVGMLLNQGNVDLPVFDTTLIHCEVALDWALT